MAKVGKYAPLLGMLGGSEGRSAANSAEEQQNQIAQYALQQAMARDKLIQRDYTPAAGAIALGALPGLTGINPADIQISPEAIKAKAQEYASTLGTTPEAEMEHARNFLTMMEAFKQSQGQPTRAHKDIAAAEVAFPKLFNYGHK